MHKHVRLIGTTALIAGASSASGTSSADSLRATGVTSCSSRVTQHAAGKSQPSRRCWRAAAREVVRLLPLWAVDADLRRDAAVLHAPVHCLIGRHDGNPPPAR